MSALNSLSQFGNLSSLSSQHSMQAAMNALAGAGVGIGSGNSSSGGNNNGSSKPKDYIPTGILR